MDYLHRTWAEIDLDSIRHNFRELKKRLSGSCLTMAVVKADARSEEHTSELQSQR